MVLMMARQALSLVALCLLLNACTHMQATHDDNRMPQSKVIPASTKQAEREDESQVAPSTSPKKRAPAASSAYQSSPSTPNSTSSGTTAAPKKSDVLDAILQQAGKAIDNNQWLRAQHHLEHALRIAPQHAQTFYLYAQVYQGLGVPDKSRQMLKRALFLSRPDSDLHQTVKRALDAQVDEASAR